MADMIVFGNNNSKSLLSLHVSERYK